MRSIEEVYKGRDNTVDLKLKADGAAINLSSIEKMELIGDGWSADSTSDTSGVFDLSAGGGVAVLSLGGITDLPDGKSTFELITYDLDNTDGIVWGSVNIYTN